MARPERVTSSRRRWAAPSIFHQLLVVAYILACVFAVACTKSRSTPEDRVRAMIKRGEQAVRDKDSPALMALVADGYSDDEGRTKPLLKGVVARYFLANRAIHLLTRIQSITFPTPQRAAVSLFAATMGTEVGDLKLLPSVKADLYRLQLRLIADGDDWLVQAAEWHPATMDEFLGEQER